MEKKRLKDVTVDPLGYEDDPGTTKEVLSGFYMLLLIGAIVFGLCSAVTYGVMTLIDYLKTLN